MTKTKQKYLEQKREYNQRPYVKAQRKQYKEKYYREKKDALLQQQRDYYAIPENRAKKLLSKTKERATKDGIAFDLDVKDIVIPSHCPYLGLELTHHLGQGYLDSNSSIDRIIPEKGYVRGNIQIISRLANQMKNSATPEQLLTFAFNVINIHREKQTNDSDYDY